MREARLYDRPPPLGNWRIVDDDGGCEACAFAHEIGVLREEGDVVFVELRDPDVVGGPVEIRRVELVADILGGLKQCEEVTIAEVLAEIAEHLRGAN